MKACGIDTNAPVAVFLDSFHVPVIGDFAPDASCDKRRKAPQGDDAPAPVKPPNRNSRLFTASDPVRADAFVTKFIAAASEVPSDIKTEQDGDITLILQDGWPRLLRVGFDLVCNTRALLQAVAVRMKDPGMRYGTTACPSMITEIATWFAWTAAEHRHRSYPWRQRWCGNRRPQAQRHKP
jgi:hypothetical protein